ncbi:MAG: hypothetical protein RL172_2131 [Bacteroidota bacterium]|jgi:hypothetical protein
MRGTGLLINDDYELKVIAERDGTGKIVTGVAIGKTTYQNTGFILAARKGEFKQLPALGVGIEDVLLDDDYLEWRRRIRLNLELDEQQVTGVNFSGVEKLKIESRYL